MAGTSGYVVKVSGKRAASGAAETLYVDLTRLILATDSKEDLSILLEGRENVVLTGEDATWVREILDEAVATPEGATRECAAGQQPGLNSGWIFSRCERNAPPRRMARGRFLRCRWNKRGYGAATTVIVPGS
ncbi:MAG: hypothetical protein U0232_31990 [Thermomicrobiales bacterium]